MKAVNCENVKSTLLQNKYPGVGVQYSQMGMRLIVSNKLQPNRICDQM